MNEWMWWAALAGVFLAPLVALRLWTRADHRRSHTWGFRGDGGDGDVERARAMSQFPDGGWGASP